MSSTNADAIWSAFKRECAALRGAKNQKERLKCVKEAQEFLDDQVHRQFLHKWRAWGLLLPAILHVLKSDAQPYLAASRGASVKKTKPRAGNKGTLHSVSPPKAQKTKSNRTPPRLDYWNFLHNEFAAAHTVDGPQLHLDPNGRDCVKQLFEFAVSIVERETLEDDDVHLVAQIETAAWQTIQLIVQYRVYCAVLDKEKLRSMTELALAGVDHGNTSGSSLSVRLCAIIAQQFFQHCPYDMHDWLEKALNFLEKWFDGLTPESTARTKKFEDIAPILMEAATDLIKSYFSSIGPLALRTGVAILHYIQRSWNNKKIQHRGYDTEYIIQFLALYACHTPEIVVDGSDSVQLNPKTVLKELNVIKGMLLNPKDVHQLVIYSKSGRGSLIFSITGGSAFHALMDMDAPILSHLRCAADVVYHHDRLVTELSEHNLMIDNELMSDTSTVTGTKRPRPEESALAWEALVDTLCIDPSAESLSDSVSSSSSLPTPASSPGKALSSAKEPRSSSKRVAVKKQDASWILLVAAVLCRHGEYYLKNRLGDVMRVMGQLAGILESKDLEQRQYVTLLTLVQLSRLSAMYKDLCCGMLDDAWKKVWRILLRPDLPYVHATESAVLSKDFPGDAVLGLLRNCVLLGLVPHAVVEASQNQLWDLSAFRSNANGLTTASKSLGTMSMTVSVSAARLLGTLLQCIELQDEKDEKNDDAVLASPISTINEVPSKPTSVRSSLLSALFSHLELQAFQEKNPGVMTPNWAEAVAISPISYASAVLSFIQPSKSLDNLDLRNCFTTQLLQNLSTLSEDSDSDDTNCELNGFGVYFTLHECGLVSMRAPEPTTPAPHRFSSIVQDYVSDDSFSGYSETSTGVNDKRDTFERLQLPSHLLKSLRCQDDELSNVGAFKRPLWANAGFPSISKETQLAMHAEVSGHFLHLVDCLSKKIRVTGVDARATMQLLATALDIGLVLAALFPELPRPVDGAGMVDIAHLLKKVLAIVAENLKATTFGQALQDSSAARSAIHFLMKFHSLILILQGKATILGCCHPSADPVDLRIPSALRPSIRKIVGAIEEGLALLASGANSFTNDHTGSQSTRSSLSQSFPASASSVLPSQTASLASNTSETEAMKGSSSQIHLTPSSQAATVTDDFDDGNESQHNAGVSANSLVVKTLSLWCFRVLLLLKKDSGLKTVSDLAAEVQFTPDFVLGLSALLCGVAGCDSLELMIKLIDYATEASRSGRKFGDNFWTVLFNSQALTVLKLAGLMHERRKSQYNEEIPEQLLLFAREFLDSAHDGCQDTFRNGRQVDVECLEVFFRLKLDMFDDFVDISMNRLIDVDFSVRASAVCSMQTLFYMYPEGGIQLFKDLSKHLSPLLPRSDPEIESKATETSKKDILSSAKPDITTIDSCVTVMLALYVGACSSEDVLPQALTVFMQLALSEVRLYSSPSSPLLRSWLSAISRAYSYPTLSRLLDDHFCFLWYQFIAMNMHTTIGSTEEQATTIDCEVTSRSSATELLKLFPRALLGGSSSQRTEDSLLDGFADKVDIIFPIGVLYDSIDQADMQPGEFAFVNELTNVFFKKASMSDDDEFAVRRRAAVDEQLTTDLFAISFVLQSSPDPASQELAARMLTVAEDKAATSALSMSHLGHVVCKMARFTIWDLTRSNDQPSEPNLWKDAIAKLKEKYSGFVWTKMNLAELLSEFYVMLLRTEFSESLSSRAVHCFYLFVRETQNAFESDCVLQQLLLRICFQVIKQLASRRREVARELTLLVQETCEQFMKAPEVFGKYLSFVIHEISDILSRSGDRFHGGNLQLFLQRDDKANLEWVVFAVCNNMANGLGKHILDIDAVPIGVSSSLDKLNSLIAGSRKVIAPEKTTKSSIISISNDSNGSNGSSSIRQIETFLQKANDVGGKFYRQSRLLRSSGTEHQQGTRSKSTARRNDVAACRDTNKKLLSTSLLRLATVESSVGELEDMFDRKGHDQAAPELLGKLTKTLFYLSSNQDSMAWHQSGVDWIPENDVLVSIADALSAVGALDGTQADLNPGSDTAYLSRLYQQQFSRGALRETKINFLLLMHERLLVYLSSLLFEEKELGADVIQETVVTLKSLLRLDEGMTALAKCKDSELKAFLDPFVESPSSNWSNSSLMTWQLLSQDPNVPVSRQQHAQLWKSGNALGFDVWIRSMTSYLASKSKDSVLSACATLAHTRTEMAIFLFPYVLWAILRKSSTEAGLSRIVTVVQSGVRDIIASAAKPNCVPEAGNAEENDDVLGSEPLAIVQLLIHTVNFLREIEKAYFVESNGGAVPSDKKSSVIPRNSSSAHQQFLSQAAYGCGVDVNLLDLAMAAIHAKMPYSAMQYVEMWLEEKNGGMIPCLSSNSQEDLDENARRILVEAYSFDNNVDGIYGINDGRTLESQLITYNREGSYTKALPLYDVSLQTQSTKDSAHMKHLAEGMFTSLRNLGYHNLLQGYLQSLGTVLSVPSVSPQMNEFKYELAWKSLQWGAAGTSLNSGGLWRTNNVGSPDQQEAPYHHQQVLYQSLKALAHGDTKYLFLLTKKSKEQILKSVQLSLRGLESTRESYKALLWLESIRDIEEAACAAVKTVYSEPAVKKRFDLFGGVRNPLQATAPEGSVDLPSLFSIWQKRHVRVRNDFEQMENLLSLQEALLKILDARNSHGMLAELHLSLASVSRKAKRIAVAYRALTKLEQMQEQGVLGVHQAMQWKLEKAKLLWTQQETRSAIWTAKLLQLDLESCLREPASQDQRASLQMLHVAVLTKTGKWIASQRSENSQVIIEDYFQKATDLVDSMGDAVALSTRAGSAAKAYMALAEFMADMHHQVHTRVTSREWLAGKRVAEARHQELKACLAMEQSKQLENRAHIHALNKEVTYDIEERSRVEASVAQFLMGALQSYGKGLALSPKAELAVVFRLLSLWFSNQLKTGTNEVMQEVINVVPSYKFVPLSYQIISRITGSDATSRSSRSSKITASENFQRVLRVLVLKLCQQHPHHALVQLLALKNSGDVEGKGAAEFRANVGDAKAEGAKRYIEKLRQTDGQRELLESLDILSNAYIQLALFDTRDYHKQGKKIALSKVPIVGIGGGQVSFDQCLRDRTRRGANRTVMPAVLTRNVAPRADMDYSGVVRVLSFEPLFSITDSGIHRPKIIYCHGSDGRRFKQLVKGKDDTRQDLVIEQAFETVNHFLKEDQQTRQRNLRLLTYKVVPLSPIAGVLEWVDNTIPWGSYLVGRTAKRLSAHERYHPHEWKHMDCRMHLKNAKDKLETYKAIEANFTPVFHHFFLEKFPDPAMWYQRRLAYVKSAAVTSIVGYILGIGDRHSQNILIHEETAELVHIDFGVVFDQGMALFTPETVPFRLTRDLVDGMGVSGCDGVFTRCCEATLQLLRKKSASVVTILEVFVHDPLYRWTLSPLKALRIQKEENGGTVGSRSSSSTDNSSVSTLDAEQQGIGGGGNNNDAAARALIRVKQKLEGYEDPNGNALSIEGQVKQLISVAQDPHNLCNLFPGWAPWL